VVRDIAHDTQSVIETNIEHRTDLRITLYRVISSAWRVILLAEPTTDNDSVIKCERTAGRWTATDGVSKTVPTFKLSVTLYMRFVANVIRFPEVQKV